ncbi:MAG: helix-turn-helix transcriptional regulator [Clostridia bacterium]|nr:helix-turn-helix transcriptional regulator [Clostridia bacterium]
MDADDFAEMFAESQVAKEIEAAAPNYLVGKSSTEMLSEILDKESQYVTIPMNRSPEYWGGWVLAYTQWSLRKSFKEILSAISFSRIVSLYNPYHEADEGKTVDLIRKLFPTESALKRIRTTRKLSQTQLAEISGVKLRSIQCYEQGDTDIAKAQGETLHALATALDCSIEDLLG